jgi:hypothetical protein
MFNPEIRLKQSNIFHHRGMGEEGPAGSEAEKETSSAISECLIYRALKYSYPKSTETAMHRRETTGIPRPMKSADELFAMPVIDIIKLPKDDKRHVVPLFPIQLDESTVENNIEILRNIHVQQCGLKPTFFEQKPGPVLPVGGDNKTLQRIWNIALTSTANEQTYNQHRHLLALPGLFHAAMNLARGIIGVYYNGDKSKKKRSAEREEPSANPDNRHIVNPSTLQRTQIALRRKFVAPESTQLFTHQRSFIIDNFEGRVLALLFAELGIPRAKSRLEISAIIGQLTRKRLIRAIRAVARVMKDPVPEHDKERQVHMWFLRDAGTFIVLRHAVKYGDVGLIMRCVGQMAVFFHGTNRWAYAHEMLYLLYVMRTDFTNDVAKKALLAALLVNPSGRPDGWYPIDLSNEQLNRDIKDTWSYRHSSTSDVRFTTEYGTINGMFLRRLANNIFSIHSRPASGTHPPANRSNDIYVILREIYDSINSKPVPLPNAPPPVSSKDSGWRPALNAYAIGLSKILGDTGKLAAFNQANRELGVERTSLQPGDANDEGDGEEDFGTGHSILLEADALEVDGDGGLKW